MNQEGGKEVENENEEKEGNLVLSDAISHHRKVYLT